MDTVGELVLAEKRGDARLLAFADGDVDGGDARDGEEGSERVEQDGHATELEELFGGGARGGHAGADAGGGKNDEDRHGMVSIQNLERRDQKSEIREQRSENRERRAESSNCRRCARLKRWQRRG